jgi:L-ascorbate metabolism protein UlaG (beta-lactamase superfamily)
VIQYIGRSCFLIVAPDGTRIVTDPYSCAAKYLPFPADVKADLITVSHGLDDFFHVHALRGRPTIISEGICSITWGQKIAAQGCQAYEPDRKEFLGASTKGIEIAG